MVDINDFPLPFNTPISAFIHLDSDLYALRDFSALWSLITENTYVSGTNTSFIHPDNLTEEKNRLIGGGVMLWNLRKVAEFRGFSLEAKTRYIDYMFEKRKLYVDSVFLDIYNILLENSSYIDFFESLRNVSTDVEEFCNSCVETHRYGYIATKFLQLYKIYPLYLQTHPTEMIDSLIEIINDQHSLYKRFSRDVIMENQSMPTEALFRSEKVSKFC